ncbi:polysaccharide deacetylase family protein [Bordetella sp. 15P40C-2]|uniref:polysaccharide deacetylase family protein n=1 Tax=Bordetella sp. 15P40C-2 TaxID=2572246 RepID=UPI0013266F74|nr:polysaccharide deacetylase family protein [Bordetella sp. 15P40C-2]MVW72290.1 polysaccharide deacetylase family protein [Bordetella sp. 15P40C-2]
MSEHVDLQHDADALFAPLQCHTRFGYSAIHRRPHYLWPKGNGLAVYIGFNIEHFAFGSGMGAKLGASFGEPDVLNYSWREYGNRVGAWRCLELFDNLGLPTGVIANTAILDHCPELIEACVARGDEIIAHGHTNAEHQGAYSEAAERALLQGCAHRFERSVGVRPTGWLSPWIAESHLTPDLLAESGYRYTLNWCHDDQPTQLCTRDGGQLWSIPYPQEVNDIPMIVARQMDGKDFAQLIIDNFDEMLEQSRQQPLVMGIALHPYLVGQPYRLRYLRRALSHIAAYRDRDEIWFTTPGAICDHVTQLNQATAV